MKKNIIRIKGYLETTPFSMIDYLEGQVFGHPNFNDGDYVRVANVVWDTDEEAWISPSGRYYRVVSE